MKKQELDQIIKRRGILSEGQIEEQFPRRRFSPSISRDVYYGANVPVQVLSRWVMGLTTHDSPYIVISITDPGQNQSPDEQDHAKIPQSPNLKAILPVSFYDTNIDYENEEKTYPCINDQQAARIAKFLMQHIVNNKQTPIVVCHCEAGISRSSGLAAAIVKFFDDDNDGMWISNHFYPNMTVFIKVFNALQNEYINSKKK